MPSLQRLLDQRVTAAMRAAYPEITDAPAIVVLAADSRFGDYQANGAMAMAKRLKMKPRDVAEKILAHLDLADHSAEAPGTAGGSMGQQPRTICDPPQIAGPGFINLHLRPDWLSRQVGLINKPSETSPRHCRGMDGGAAPSEGATAAPSSSPRPAAGEGLGVRGNVPLTTSVSSDTGDVYPAGATAAPFAAVPSDAQQASDDRLGVEPAARPETVVVDYSAPNLAKEMHVGHLRSTIIGDALARMLAFAGHTVVRQNHVGDWGTQFGMLVAELAKHRAPYLIMDADGEGANIVDLVDENFEIGDLEEFYRQAKKNYDSDPAFAETARSMVVLIQSGLPGEPEHERALDSWQGFCQKSQKHANQVYAQLGVLLTDADIRGESAYNAFLPSVIEYLKYRGMLAKSDEAQCVFLNDDNGKPLFVNKDGTPLPLIVQKSDEGYLYATTDLAAIGFRTGFFRELPAGPNTQVAPSPHAARILYVVDARQAQHFKMVFLTARLAGFAKPETVLEHIAFGTMMGPDGKPFKTRDGGTVKLMDLLKEAEKRAYDLVKSKNAADVAAERAPALSEEDMQKIAHKIGIGAVKYADLSQNRTSDYVFSWEKMLALDGNTAPYMQYAYARVRSIFRKAWPDLNEAALHAEEARLHQDASPITLEKPEEVALAKRILQFPEIIDRTLDDYRPNILAAYLYDLAGAFTAFYNECPVIQSAEPTRTARLKLCDLTARIIQRGLGLLGIETAERM